MKPKSLFYLILLISNINCSATSFFLINLTGKNMKLYISYIVNGHEKIFDIALANNEEQPIVINKDNFKIYKIMREKISKKIIKKTLFTLDHFMNGFNEKLPGKDLKNYKLLLSAKKNKQNSTYIQSAVETLITREIEPLEERAEEKH